MKVLNMVDLKSLELREKRLRKLLEEKDVMNFVREYLKKKLSETISELDLHYAESKKCMMMKGVMNDINKII